MSQQKSGQSDDPKGGKPTSSATKQSKKPKRQKREHSLPFKILVGVITGFAALFLLAVIAFAVLYLVIDIPKANPQAQQQVSVVYYADGKTEMGRFTTTNREPVELKQVPLSVQRAFLSAEDRSFYQNRGISPTGIGRAFVNNFRGSGGQGGSTITQQYVKNYFLTQDQTVTRKVKEIVISLKIDQEYSKDRILQDYLNNIYFGRGAYGIEAASKSYFHKDVSKLTPVEGAFLAAIVNNPDNMDPTVGPNSEARANSRMAYVLNGMVEQQWMTPAERAAAVMPKFYKREPIKYADGPQGYIIQSVRNELAHKLDLSQTDIDRGGLRITTTIDKRTEDEAIKAVQKNIPKEHVNQLKTGLVAQRANDGAIVAMYGGRDYDPIKAPYSDADQSVMQQASSAKIFTAIAAMKDGKKISDKWNGNSPYYMSATSRVTNDGGYSWGYQPLYNMLAYSINTAFVRLNGEIGGKATLQEALDSGIPKSLGGMDIKSKADTNSINTLGTADARVVDMAEAYNTLNSGGEHYDGYLISKVRTFDGNYSYDVKKKPKRAYAKGIADDVTWALNKTALYGTAKGAQANLGRPMAAKTGTASGNKYIWFNGFTPGQLTTSVGMYYTKDGGKTVSSMQGLKGLTAEQIYGAGLPQQIWMEFMKAALKGQKETKIPERAYYNDSKPKTSSTPSSTPERTYQAPTQAPPAQQPAYPQPTRTQQVIPSQTDSPEPSQQPQVPSSTVQPQPTRSATSTQAPRPSQTQQPTTQAPRPSTSSSPPAPASPQQPQAPAAPASPGATP